MKKVILSLLLSVCLNGLHAQEILKFKDIPIVGNIEDFNHQMKEKNYIFLSDLYHSYHYFGMFYGRKVDISVGYVPETKQVSGVSVNFPETGDKADKLYDGLTKQLDKKYNSRKETYVSGLLIWTYGKEYEITLSRGEQTKKVSLSYNHKAKSEERYFYQNKHLEIFGEHQKDL